MEVIERIVNMTGREDTYPSVCHPNPVLQYVADAIGRSVPTPVTTIRVNVDRRPRIIMLKLDGMSPWGSIKGRTALALIASVANRIHSHSRIVESTSGNLGVALAKICHDLNVPFTAVVDSRLPPGLAEQLVRLGAHLDHVADEGDSRHLMHRIERVRKILSADKEAVWPNQYENPASVAVHRSWTGPELDSQIGACPLQALFVPVSTGGSFVGLRHHMARHKPWVSCVAIDVTGSTIFGGSPAPRLLTGIGASKPSGFIGQDGGADYVMVSDVDAIATCRTLADDTGIGLGGSSGATIAGCIRFLRERPDLNIVLCMCPDMAESYRHTLYNDEWLIANGAANALRPASISEEPTVFTKANESSPDGDK
jgi:N-(2-amino-2-carboxyethyl)-L-glutamate synthase